jgi:hypothetical protein
MWTTLPFMKPRMHARMGLRGTPIRLTWVTLTGVTEDPTTGSRIGTVTPNSETVMGFVHFPQISQRAVRIFEEIEEGDCIIDIPEATTIEGREQLTFTIDNQIWVQKKIGDKLAQTWSVQQGTRLYRTLLLRKQS